MGNFMYAMGRLDFKDVHFLESVCDHVASQLPTFTSQGLSNTAYGLGLLRFRHDGFALALCSHAPGRLAEFTPQNLSNTVYGLGRMGFRRKGSPHSSFFHSMRKLSPGVLPARYDLVIPTPEQL